jgi:hypothetical protein
VRRLAVLALAALLALGLGACGRAETSLRTTAETEGVPIVVGNVTYQVQVSRLLNPADPEDRDYFAGMPGSTTLPRGESWFGIFIQATNFSGDPAPSARQFVVVDTDGQRFEPVPLGPANVFAYNPQTLQPNEMIPEPDSAAFNGPVRGSLVLFRLPDQVFYDRPVKLLVESPSGQGEADVTLDI